MQYKKIISVGFIGLSLLATKVAYAVCPVCTVAISAGVGIAEWLGINDSISGLWIGALVVSMSIWTINWLDKRDLRFRGRKILVFVVYYLIVVGSLYWKGMIGHPLNKLCGVDKLLFGIILGSFLFATGVIFHNWLRKRNNNISYFKGQKIALPVGLLVITSLVLYYVC